MGNLKEELTTVVPTKSDSDVILSNSYEHRHLYHFFSFRGIFVYLLTRVLSRSEYLFSKNKSQHEDSHELPRILTFRSYKYVLSTISFIFDSLETLTLVTILHQSSKFVFFPADVAKPDHRFFVFPQLYNVYRSDSLEYYHCPM